MKTENLGEYIRQLREQAEMFSEASAVIGASGAAWVGMIFCKHPVVGLSWLPMVYKEFSSYSTLAKILGHRLYFVEAKTEKELKETGEAYNAGYTVDPDEFKDGLEKLMKALAE